MKITTTLLIATTIAGGMLLMGCSNTAEDQADQMEGKMDKVQDDLNEASGADDRAEYERERNDALDRLYNMRGNIDKKLLDVNEKLTTKDMDAEKRAEKDALKAELEKQQTEVARLIDKVENSAQGTWINVKEDVRSGSEKMEDWWERTKDNMDGSTNDGTNRSTDGSYRN